MNFLKALKVVRMYDTDGGSGAGGGDPTPPTEPTPPTSTDVEALQEQAKQDAQNEFLQLLGVKDLTELQALVNKQRDYEDSQKTELEKINGDYEALKGSLGEKDSTIENLNALLVATRLQVPEAKANDVITLAKNYVDAKTDMTAAIAKVVELYPHFTEGTPNSVDPQVPAWSTGKNGRHTKATLNDEQWSAAFK